MLPHRKYIEYLLSLLVPILLFLKIRFYKEWMLIFVYLFISLDFYWFSETFTVRTIIQGNLFHGSV